MASSFLGQYSTQFRVDSTGPVGIAFGFSASQVRVVNRGGVPWHVSFASTVGSTGAPELRAGETIAANFRLPVSGVALATTSTTTSTAGEDTLVEVNAWG